MSSDDTPSRACLVANPAAGRGRGARVLVRARHALATLGVTDVRVTQKPGDETAIARQAALDGIDTIIALGGDGTWGNVARGIHASGRDARLALITAGTGNDFANTLGLPAHDVETMARVALEPGEARVDLGRLDGTPFLNVAGIGIETAVLQSSARIRRLRGPLLYLAAALPLLRTYRPFSACVEVDGEPLESGPLIAVIVSNGPRFGGGFRIAPGASPFDGQLDFVSVGDATTMRRAELLGRVRMGTHVSQPEVSHRRMTRAVLTLPQPPLIDLDGELVPAASGRIEIDCLASALRVAVPARRDRP